MDYQEFASRVNSIYEKTMPCSSIYEYENEPFLLVRDGDNEINYCINEVNRLIEDVNEETKISNAKNNQDEEIIELIRYGNFGAICEIITDNSDNWGFEEEYGICDECNQVIKTQADCYSWTPKYWIGDGYFQCQECTKKSPKDYIRYLRNNPNACNTLLDLEDYGFTLLKDELESGWYGTNDKPVMILDNILKLEKYSEIIFTLDQNQQFCQIFSVWVR